MAVQDKSSDYNKRRPEAQKCRDCIEGEDTLHEAGKTYLPGLEGSENDKDVQSAYDSYLQRAAYFNTVERTKSFLKGMVIRNPPNVNFPEDMEHVRDDVTGTGINFYNFASNVLEEILSVGWGGILVDYSKVEDDVKTKEDAKKKGYRSTLTWYPMESIFNTEINIRLYETKITVKNEFDITEEERIRVLDLDSEGFYRQRVYKKSKNKKKEEWILSGKPIYSTIGGEKIKFIPFYPCGADINSLSISKSPLLDLANISLHHYGVYADYRNGIHFTGFPQLYITGHKDEEKKLRMGSGVAWEFEEPNAVVKYAEFTGRGLEHPEKLLDRLETQMGKLGARMLMADKKTAESSDKVKQDSSSEASLLAGIANNVSSALGESLNTAMKMEGISLNKLKGKVVVNNKIIVELNTDYDSSKIDPALLVALMKGIQSGYVTEETFLYNLKKGEILPVDTIIEDELKKLEKARVKLEKRLKTNALSERNSEGFIDPKDELRDVIRTKNDFT